MTAWRALLFLASLLVAVVATFLCLDHTSAPTSNTKTERSGSSTTIPWQIELCSSSKSCYSPHTYSSFDTYFRTLVAIEEKWWSVLVTRITMVVTLRHGQLMEKLYVRNQKLNWLAHSYLKKKTPWRPDLPHISYRLRLAARMHALKKWCNIMKKAFSLTFQLSSTGFYPLPLIWSCLLGCDVNTLKCDVIEDMAGRKCKWGGASSCDFVGVALPIGAIRDSSCDGKVWPPSLPYPYAMDKGDVGPTDIGCLWIEVKDIYGGKWDFEVWLLSRGHFHVPN